MAWPRGTWRCCWVVAGAQRPFCLRHPGCPPSQFLSQFSHSWAGEGALCAPPAVAGSRHGVSRCIFRAGGSQGTEELLTCLHPAARAGTARRGGTPVSPARDRAVVLGDTSHGTLVLWAARVPPSSAASLGWAQGTPLPWVADQGCSPVLLPHHGALIPASAP